MIFDHASRKPPPTVHQSLAVSFTDRANLLTLAGLALGGVSIRLCLSGDLCAALIAICFAALADLLDGPVSRLTSRQPDAPVIGGNLDSLSDMMNYGVAMPLLVTRSNPQCQIDPFLFLACSLLVAIRLAIFNSMASEERVYVGLPAPHVVMFVPAAYLLGYYWGGDSSGYLMRTVLFCCIVLYVAPIRFPRPSVLFYAVCLGLFVLYVSSLFAVRFVS